MGQKVNPIGFRIPLTKDWRSRWFADKRRFGEFLAEDDMIRSYIKSSKELAEAGISDVVIERFANRVRIILFSARPGVAIGRKGRGASGAEVPEAEKGKNPIDITKVYLQKKTGKEIYIELREVVDSPANAQLVAAGIADQLVRRMPLKRAMKRAQQDAMKAGVDGIKIYASGRINGAEISRAEWIKEGKVPLHTLRANIDFGFAEAATTAGRIGVKVWICKSDDYKPMKPTAPGERRGRRPSHAANA